MAGFTVKLDFRIESLFSDILKRFLKYVLYEKILDRNKSSETCQQVTF